MLDIYFKITIIMTEEIYYCVYFEVAFLFQSFCYLLLEVMKRDKYHFDNLHTHTAVDDSLCENFISCRLDIAFVSLWVLREMGLTAWASFAKGHYLDWQWHWILGKWLYS